MMKKKILIITVLFSLLSLTNFAQQEPLQIVDSLKQKKSNSLWEHDIEVYQINLVKVQAPKFEMTEVVNPEYVIKKNLIDSIENDNTQLQEKVETFKKDEENLRQAYAYMDGYIRSAEPETSKYGYLSTAQEKIDKTNYKIDFYRSKKQFYEACGGRLSDATNRKNYYKIEKYIYSNMESINKILNDNNSLENKIQYNTKVINKTNDDLKNIQEKIKKNIQSSFFEREILLVDTVNIAQQIQGSYIMEKGPVDIYGQSCYSIMLKDFHHFLKNELVIKDSIKQHTNDIRGLMKHVGGNNEYLIKNVDTNELYFTKGDILKRWCLNPALVALLKTLDELNIKTYSIENKTLVSYQGNQCVLTPDIFERLMKKDVSVISEMQSSVNKYLKYNSQASLIAEKLMKHINSYQSLLLTYDRLDDWKKDTKECEAILTNMRNLPFAKSIHFNNQLEEDDIKLHTVVIDYVLYSKQHLGL